MVRILILALVLAMPVSAQAPKSSAFIEKVQPFLDEHTLVVARFDLSRVQLEPFIGLLAAMEGNEEEVVAGTNEAKAWLKEFSRKGGRDVFVTYGAGDYPNMPVLLIPIGESPELRNDLAQLVKMPFGDDPEYTTEKVFDCMAVGKKSAIEAIKTRKATKREDLLEGLQATANDPIQLVFSFSEEAKKIHEQVAPLIPEDLGGGSITKLTRSLKWMSLNVGPTPQLSVRMVFQGINADAVKEFTGTRTTMSKLLQRAIKEVIPGELNGMRAKLEKSLEAMTEKTDGSRYTLELELGPILKEFKQSGKDVPATAAARMRSANNLKQLALAMHNYHDAIGHFPTNIVSKDGKPLLSWRVHLLPYLDQQQLYTQFKLNEPWDSEHNKKLIPLMPKVFRAPLQGEITKDKTTYLAPLGKGFLWDDPKGMKIQMIADGTSNTIMFLEADDEVAVTWTQPDDLKIDPKDPLKNLLGHYTTVFQAAIADGSIRTFKKSLPKETFLAWLTYSGGEVINLEK